MKITDKKKKEVVFSVGDESYGTFEKGSFSDRELFKY